MCGKRLGDQVTVRVVHFIVVELDLGTRRNPGRHLNIRGEPHVQLSYLVCAVLKPGRIGSDIYAQ